MSKSYNSVTLMGNIASEPVIKQTHEGKNFALFTVACGYEWKDKQTGNKEHGCDFIPCSAFGWVADVIASYAPKGKQVMVTGEIKARKYADKDGEKKTSISVLADNIFLLGGGPKEDVSHAKTPASMAEPKYGNEPDYTPEPDYNPEAQIPF